MKFFGWIRNKIMLLKNWIFRRMERKLQFNGNWTAVLLFVVLGFPVNLVAQEFEFEAETSVLSNGAAVQNASECSGSQQVGNLGGTQNGSVTKVFEVPLEGDYDLSISYCTADQRSFSVWVNYGMRLEVVCSPSGGWSTPSTVQIQIALIEGQNTLVFDNPNGWAPNLDQFSLTPSPTFNISGNVQQDETGVLGVTLSLSGAKNGNIETDENGTYSFTGLTGGKSYTITPTKEGSVFDPPYLSFDPLLKEESLQDFEVVPVCVECIESFKFGTNGELKYSTQTGTYSMYFGDHQVISSAYSMVKNSDVSISSLDYEDRQVFIEDISDDFGDGQKMIVTLTAQDLPDMQQVFYAYDGSDYFLAEVFLRGESVVSNYMAPLVSSQVDIAEAGDNRFLFVPFDNDGFIRYRSHKLENYTTATSSEVTAFYDDISRKGLVVGSVEHATWKTGIKGAGEGRELSSLVAWGGYTDKNVTRDAKAHGSISGEEIKSPKLFVGYFDDWRVGMEEYGRANAVAEPRYVFEWDQPTPFGWNSWGAIQTDLSLNKAKAVVDFFVESLPDFRNGETAYIDLDSYWDNMVSGGLEGDFSNLVAFANYCKSKGLKPGIYWGPFVDWGKYDRQVEGSVYSYAAAWTKVNGAYHDEDGGRAMDPTHPATQDRISLLVDKFIACGFEMIKIDFIGHASVDADHYYDPEVTTGMQAFRKGMEYLVDQLNDKMLIYAAISPNLATARYVHSRRIACDAYADIGATEYTLNSNTYGWWQDQMYDFIDGDHLVFGSSSIGENRARLASGVINGTIFTGDDFSVPGQWSERARILLQNQDVLEVAKDGVAFRPVDGHSESGASEIFVKEAEGIYDVIVVNYEDAKTFNLDFDRLGIQGTDYGVRELFSGEEKSYNGSSISIDVPSRDAVILRFSKGFPDAVGDISEGSAIRIFPNPTQAKIHIEGRNNIESVKLYHSTGALVESINEINQNKTVVDMEGSPDGVYVVSVIEKGGSETISKIIKTNK